jgi:hypothetical protein
LIDDIVACAAFAQPFLALIQPPSDLGTRSGCVYHQE